MTERLYYDNAYLTEFDAAVLEVSEGRVLLNRSAFYPTSGGQPFDTGTLNGYAVKDVFVDDLLNVWHVTDAKLQVGQAVHGVIDWPRRFDHMQQHAGEHMLANACFRHLGGNTIGLHLGHDVSTIDVELPGGVTRIDSNTLAALEDDVNTRIQQNVAIRCWFPTAEELETLPLRKAPTVKEHIRVVNIGTEEYVACGGTHPSSSGQIGLLKIVDARPNRGKLRLAFVCGMRAFLNYRHCYDISGAVAESLSTGRENLKDAVVKLQQRLYETRHELEQLRRETLLNNADSMLQNATVLQNGNRIVRTTVTADMPLLRDLASYLCRNAKTIVLLGAPAPSGDTLYIFARSSDVSEDMGRLLSISAKNVGGKGGGKPDFAQGSGPEQALDEALKLLNA